MLKKYTITSILLLLPLFSSADSVSFDYVDFGFSNLDYPFSNQDGGYELKFSKTLSDNFYLSGDLASVPDSTTKLVAITLGVGYKFDFSSSLAFFSEIDFASFEIDNGDGEFELDGYEVTAGIRTQLSEEFDSVIGVEWTDLDYNNGYTSLLIGGSYSVMSNLGVYAEVKTSSDASRFAVGFRYNF